MLVSPLKRDSPDRTIVEGIAAETAAQLDVDAELDRDHARLWVCRLQPDTPVVAFLLAWHVADEVHLIHIATHSSARRQGAGKALLNRLLDFASEAAARLVLLEVRRSNTAAISLYRRLGFCAIGVRRAYYADNREDAIEMLLTLDPQSGEVVPGRDEIQLG